MRMIPSITWAESQQQRLTLLPSFCGGCDEGRSSTHPLFFWCFCLKSLFLCHCGQDDTSQNSLYVRFDLSVSHVCSWNWKHGAQLSFSCTAGRHFQWQMEWHGCILMLKQLYSHQKQLKIQFDLNMYKFHIYIMEIALWIHLLAMRL